MRDLTQSSTLKGEHLKVCIETFLAESAIYTRVRELANRDDLTDVQRKNNFSRLSGRLRDLAVPNKYDPIKLKTYKETLIKNVGKYLTCVRLPNVPCDNNQAERSLRHIVLKRRISSGHISARGAESMSILMSVFLTVRNRVNGTSETFFGGYGRFCRGGV